MTIPLFSNKTDQDDGEIAEYRITPAAFPKFFAKGNLKQIVFVSATALLCAVAAYISHANGNNVLHLCKQSVVALVFLSAMIIDKNTHKIPNILIVFALAIGAVLLGSEYFVSRETFLASLVASGAGSCGCLVLFYILARLTKEGIGMGDVKLIAAVGWILGITSTLFVVLASMILCSLYAMILLLGKKKNKNDTLPFGPFLYFGYIILLLLFNI